MRGARSEIGFVKTDSKSRKQAGRQRNVAAKTTSDPEGTRSLVARMKDALIPGLRDRLVAIMDESGIVPERRATYLSSITGRAWQTTRRWVSEDKPGLPDLMSTVLLSIRFDIDANWLLGLTQVKLPLPKRIEQAQSGSASWAGEIAALVSQRAPGCTSFVMQSDEMEPRIQRGAPIFVDTSVTDIQGNGMYLLEYQGRTLVRVIENRIPDGLVLSCDNKTYKESILKDAAAAKKLGIRVLGRVELWLHVLGA